jgi:hypothetical protein
LELTLADVAITAKSNLHYNTCYSMNVKDKELNSCQRSIETGEFFSIVTCKSFYISILRWETRLLQGEKALSMLFNDMQYYA